MEAPKHPAPGHCQAIRKSLIRERRHPGAPAGGTPALPETSREAGLQRYQGVTAENSRSSSSQPPLTNWSQ